MIDRDRLNVTQTRVQARNSGATQPRGLFRLLQPCLPRLEWHMVGFQESPFGESRL
jgi:hypothetical protein